MRMHEGLELSIEEFRKLVEFYIVSCIGKIRNVG